MNYKRGIKKLISNFNKIIFLKRRKTLNTAKIKNILVISLYFRGDFLFHTAFIKLLKEFLPDSKIDVWIKSRNIELAENNPDINDILIFDNIKTAGYNDNTKFDLKGKFSFLKKVRKRKYDLIIDITGHVSSALFTYFSKANYSIGINNFGFGACYNRFIDLKPASTPGHLIEKYISIIRLAFEIDVDYWDELTRDFKLKPYIFISRKEEEKVAQLLKEHKVNKDAPLIIIHTTAGWRAKEWAPYNFSRLIERLRDKGYNFLFIGDGRDRAKFSSIIENSKLKDTPGIEKFFLQLKFLEVAELIRRGNVFVGGDSAPLHLAGAVETPSVGLFGPTNLDFSNPIGEKHKVVYYKLYCSASDSMQYCTRNGGMTCPTVDCMKLVKDDEVMNLIENLIQDDRREEENKSTFSRM